jgi:hypothetical protein
MKKAAMFLAGLCFTLSVTAQEKKEVLQGNGDLIREKRQIAGFDKVKVSGLFEVNLVSGQTGTMTLDGDANILSILTTQVKDGVLIIGTANNQPVKPSPNNKVSIKVPFALLSEITLIGSGTVNVKKKITGVDLKVVIDGPGEINVRVDNQKTQAWVLGSGDINIKGSCENFDCRVVGSGTIQAYSLESRYVTALVSGCGDVEANSTKAITGRISGAGNIAFTGEPAQTDLRHSGSGKFNPINESRLD